MYHLLDNEQLELDGFNAFRPSNDQPAPPGEAETAPSPTPGARPDVDGGGSGRRLSAIKAKVKAKAKSKGGAKGEATPAAKTKAKANASAKGGGGEGRVQAGTRGGGGGVEEIDEEEMRRLGIYAAFLLPLANSMCQDRKKGTKNVRGHFARIRVGLRLEDIYICIYIYFILQPMGKNKASAHHT